MARMTTPNEWAPIDASGGIPIPEHRVPIETSGENITVTIAALTAVEAVTLYDRMMTNTYHLTILREMMTPKSRAEWDQWIGGDNDFDPDSIISFLLAYLTQNRRSKTDPLDGNESTDS